MEKIKKNWKVILLVFFVFLTLNRCTVACNRDSQIHKQEMVISQKDSIISNRDAKIDTLTHNLELIERDLKGASELINQANANNEALRKAQARKDSLEIVNKWRNKNK